ncbi:hypothetical protein FVB9288_02248 [Flavobacterium sp. CECT 9288]|uniref:tail fiber protein n=1 Tax=Flavobacterium sp. CECT 9288 TaxID=2845819 RepID=UPI001E40A4B0|nr:tail fiber protein [Flavobacterium sp. CECT 9288]CAH0336542.1 hypothetical protein FVB9288_02248 [Flavobacterium sp. CECT 9288]
MKKLVLLMLFLSFTTIAQVSSVAGDFKVIAIGTNGIGDYTKNLILIHEIFNGALLDMNNAVGTITAYRGNSGAWNRINVLEIKSSSSYNGTAAAITAFDNNASWGLKTCIYNGKKYLALDVPYSASFHNWGYQFSGWTKSTAENMISVNYEINGVAVNTNILSNITDFKATMEETHLVSNFIIIGDKVGIGTTLPDEKLTVKGKIHTQEVKVDMAGPLVPDYVFANEYKLQSLKEVETFIKQNKHLPEIPSAKEIETNGLYLAEMNMKLLQKIEELTLYVIEQEKKMQNLQDLIEKNNKTVDLQNKILQDQQKSIETMVKRLNRLEKK